MKNLKRFTAIITAVIMILGLSVFVVADEYPELNDVKLVFTDKNGDEITSANPGDTVTLNVVFPAGEYFNAAITLVPSDDVEFSSNDMKKNSDISYAAFNVIDRTGEAQAKTTSPFTVEDESYFSIDIKLPENKTGKFDVCTIKNASCATADLGDGAKLYLIPDDIIASIDLKKEETVTPTRPSSPSGGTTTTIPTTPQVAPIIEPTGDEPQIVNPTEDEPVVIEPTEPIVSEKPVIEKTKTGFPFKDVKTSDWYYDSVEFVYQTELMNGTDDVTFDPFGNVTRGMLITVLWRMDGCIQANLIMPFSDIPSGEYYAEAVRWGAAKGIVTGTSKTTFEPDKLITREELATMIYRYAQDKGLGFVGDWMFRLDFADADKVSDWAYEAICWTTMPTNGIMNGNDDGTLAPQNNATRAELAAILTRFAAKLSE